VETARIDQIYALLTEAATAWPAPSLRYYAGRPFQALLASMLSTQTREERTIAAADALFRAASTPEAVLALGEARIRELIAPVAFYHVKARHILAVCRRLLADGGAVPRTIDELLRYEGVGWKVAVLTLLSGYGRSDDICVDTHVARVGKRLGLVDQGAKEPRAVGEQLKAVLPRRCWETWNGLMVAFGREVCKPRRPNCAGCCIREYCPRIGVGA
jgi:endonuclease-3